jgi:two-component system CheB/CheR fusion protein
MVVSSVAAKKNSSRRAARTKPRRKRRASKAVRSANARTKEAVCPVVGIGGSAGGFEAASEFLRHVPPKTGLAFVIVQHLDPRYASRLPSLLGKVTPMRVMELTRRIEAEPNTVYVQPPNKCVVMKEGALELVKRTERLNLAIDHFFESLAEERGARSIGVLLSGAGSDGTAGLRAIKAAGGLTFAQDEESAKFADMPRNAIRSGFVDCILSPRDLAQQIRHIVDHPYIRRPMTDGETEGAETFNDGETSDLERIFLSLRQQMGVDFSKYKAATLRRRIQRRMALQRIKNLGEYARFLRDNKRENEALFDDLLINVTRFFRDPHLFRVLQKKLLPALRRNNFRRSELRVWVPGCATGEEVYSLAICILETFGKRAAEIRIQIFGTDLSEAMIDHARAGVYSSAVEKDVSASRLRRFFSKRDSTYQIGRRVRDLCTFARQNVVSDPPFSRLDLISCRNVLIYLGSELHKRCLPQFHHALNPGGYLILGPAESVGSFEKLFQLVDRKEKIYVKKPVPTPAMTDVTGYQGPLLTQITRQTLREPIPSSSELLQMADRIILGAYAPAAVVIDQNMQVHQFRGRTDIYLAHTPGPASLNLLQLVRPTLVADLRSAIRGAIKTKRPVRKDRAVVKISGKTHEINIQVVPFKIARSEDRWVLVIFDERTKPDKAGKTQRVLSKSAAEREITELRRELASSKESLQAIIEEQEATNEELKSANEEIESSNEELQSTNEELETTKEELQSTNEELTTLNEELSNRNLDMLQMNNDLNSLLDSIQLPIVMVDTNLIVRRATPSARSAFNVLSSDAGRPLGDLKPNFEINDLEEMLRDVIDTLGARERKVYDKDGREYLLRIRPYRTTENKIDGAVITLLNVEGEEESDGHRQDKRTKAASRAS